MELLGRQVRQLFGRHQGAAQRRLADLFQIEPGAVVPHLDEEHVALLLDADGESAFGMLAARFAHIGHFQAMVDGVAHEVHEGAAELLEHAAIE